MIIYQLNPLHGKHICYNSVEATYNNTKGWKTVTEAEFYAEYKKPEVKDIKIGDVLNLNPDSPSNVDYRNLAEQESCEQGARDLKDRYEAKFGKKPHHRMLPESIEAALKEDDVHVG